MSRDVLFIIGLLAAGSAACTETPISVPLRSLERSGEVSFVCVGPGGEGRDIDTCPDFEGDARLYALVTQTLRGEVAVVDLSAGRVVDSDTSTPGFSFLPVGESPVDIVSTPGGVASFVGVGGVGREGIFALPSTCLRGAARDLTTWPACSLPAAPGEMRVLVDPADETGAVRSSCDVAPSVEAATPGVALSATREDCPADLALETVNPGRRKLLVEMPSLGGLALIDAQELLDRPPGSFDPCLVERFIPLDVQLPATDVTQKVPSDLAAPGCVPEEINYGPVPGGFLPQPSGVEVVDGRLYVADLGAPVIHVIDVNDPCEATELPPLLPVSFESPNRVVTTRKVAVSPATRDGRRFAYAIDDFEGSVMVFDVTPGSSDRTPLVRAGAPLLPFEPPDRIALTAPARDITFALRDEPVADPETGVATVGTLCDPHPGASALAAKYRTSGDFTTGARPRKLRGVFGFVALSSGQVVVVDVEDWDAACRRPIFTNSADEEDFRGCSGDPSDVAFYTQSGAADGPRTTSGEMSCRVVDPHRTRSASFVLTSGEFGARGPSLRSFPRLQAPLGGTIATGGEAGSLAPRMLAVDFEGPGGTSTPAEVYVSNARYARGAAPPNNLDVEPGSAEALSLGLMLQQPRAFADEDVRVEFEGAVTAERPTGFLEVGASGAASILRDADGAFCSRGVEDEALAEEVAAGLGVPATALSAYAKRHSDYVQITSSVRPEGDRYWQETAPLVCDQSGKAAFLSCRAFFGTVETPSAARDLRVVQAWQDRLIVEAREGGPGVIDQIACCFGGAALKYRVRAGNQWILRGDRSGFRHDVTTDANLRCVRDCNPRRGKLRSRALEISSSTCTASDCAIGAATDEDVACVVSGGNAVSPTGAGSECIFQNLQYRFAIYRGNAPSERDLAFTFQTAGGFTPVLANLASQTAAVSPQSMAFVPQIGQIAVVDGAAAGLVLVSLDSISVSRLFF